VRAAEQLERKRDEMDNLEYRAKWQKLFDEEMALHEMGETTRRYAEEVRQHVDEITRARQKILAGGSPCSGKTNVTSYKKPDNESNQCRHPGEGRGPAP
jgi:uncharacterized protein YbbK (DUF523 family)